MIPFALQFLFLEEKISAALWKKSAADKIGVEISVVGSQTEIIDKCITALEQKGLCLQSKGDALRRWIRIPHDDDPRIITSLEHFKLNFLGDHITEAKAYLQQRPYLNRKNSSQK